MAVLKLCNILGLCAVLLVGCARGTNVEPGSGPMIDVGVNGAGNGSANGATGDGGAGANGDSVLGSGGGADANGSANANGDMNGGGSNGSSGISCDAMEGTSCADPIAINLSDSDGDGTYEGLSVSSNFKMCADVTPTDCSGAPMPGAHKETIHLVTMPIGGTLDLTLAAGGMNLGAGWASALYAISTCGDVASQLGCRSAPAASAGTTLSLPGLAQGDEIYVYVDGSDVDAEGAYRVEASVRP